MATKPKLRLEDVQAAAEPENNCQVQRFRENLDSESLAAFDTALAYSGRDLSAPRLHKLLIDSGFPQTAVPGIEAIKSHRGRTKPCRCPAI